MTEITLKNNIDYPALFASVQKGFHDEAAAIEAGLVDIRSAEALGLRLAGIHVDDVYSSHAHAYLAGRYQAYFGFFVNACAQPRDWQSQEVQAAAARDEETAANFATCWKNALYLAELGK